MSLRNIIPASEIELPAPPARSTGATIVDLLAKNAVAGALGELNSGIERYRAEPSATLKKEEIVRNLLQLELTEDVRQKLLPQFVAPEFQLLGDRRVQHPYGTPEHRYTALQSNGTEVALVQVPSGVFDTNDSGLELYVSDFAHMLKAFRGRPARLFSHGCQGLTYSFEVALDDENRDKNWRFIQWSNVAALGEGKLAVWQAFSLSRPSAAPSHAAASQKFDDSRVGCIVDVLARFARNEKPSVAAAFKNLVAASGWPKAWKDARTVWQDEPQSDARDFVEFAKAKGTFPAGHELAGRSVVGEFLRKFLASGVLGGDDADALARIVVDCALVPDADEFKKYYLR